MAEYPGAHDRFVDESRVFINQNDHKAIVLHCTGSPDPNQTADQLGDYFENTPLETSVHYGIDRLGNIDQYVLEKDGAGGNGILEDVHDPFWDQFSGNPNWHTLSIECENDAVNSLPLTAAQQAALFPLVAYLVKKYQIPIGNIKGHFTLEPIERVECPGPQFPWSELETYLQGGIMAVPTGWHDDGVNTLMAPNGVPVTDGFRKWILTHSWDPKNVPLRPAEGRSPLQISNPGLGNGTRLVCHTTTLGWTSRTNVFEIWAGQELLAVEHALSVALAKAN